VQWLSFLGLKNFAIVIITEKITNWQQKFEIQVYSKVRMLVFVFTIFLAAGGKERLL
jgi:hypothetical protein